MSTPAMPPSRGDPGRWNATVPATARARMPSRGLSRSPFTRGTVCYPTRHARQAAEPQQRHRDRHRGRRHGRTSESGVNISAPAAGVHVLGRHTETGMPAHREVYVYGARWCPVTGPLARSLGRTGAEVTLVDCEKEPVRADKAKVVSLPTVVVLAGGVEVARFAGIVTFEQVKEALRRAPLETSGDEEDTRASDSSKDQDSTDRAEPGPAPDSPHLDG